MKLKTKTLGMATIVVLLLVAMPVNTEAGSIGYPEVFKFQLRNFAITNLNFNRSDHVLSFEAIPHDDSWYNIGLAMFHLKFNYTHPPDVQELNVYMNGELQNPIDMVKNYTLIEGTHISAVLGTIVDCWYFRVYFYLFENKTITDEYPMSTAFGPEWNDTGNPIEPPPEPATISAINPISKTHNISNSKSRIFFNLGIGTEPPLLNRTTVPIIIGSVAVVALVILTYFIYRRL